MGVGPYLREATDVIIRAVIGALLCSAFFFTPFRIPTPSMEPTLLGDAEETHLKLCPFERYHAHPLGDHVLVSRFYYGLTPVRRWDVLVFRYPLDISKPYIKRVVGLPGEGIVLEGGDVYVNGALAAKPMDIQDSVWVRLSRPYVRMEDVKDDWITQGDLRFGEGSIELTPTGDPLFSFRHSITDRGSRISDVRLGMHLSLQEGELGLRLINAYGQFDLCLAPEKAPRLICDGKSRDIGDPFREGRVEMMFFDGRLVVRIDGRVIAEQVVARSGSDYRSSAFGTHAQEFYGRRAKAMIRDLRVDRDVYYKRRDQDPNLKEGEPLHVPPGEYFLLGDNSPVSKDGRVWQMRTYLLKDGTRIECDRDAVEIPTDQSPFRDRQGRPPQLVVRDRWGQTVPIFNGDLEEELPPKSCSTVPEAYIVGKAFWIWWPTNRWFRAIR